jgi:uncharacterized protein (DUF488 family)
MAELFTLGYEGTALPHFLNVLRTRDVSVVIDVRAMPLSRKPGFSKSALRQGCASVGIDYEHWPTLGCPKPIRQAYKLDGDWSAYVRQFKMHLPEISDEIERLASRSLRERICLVCFEADPGLCHRSLIATAVHQSCPQIEIVHLNSKGLAVLA